MVKKEKKYEKYLRKWLKEEKGLIPYRKQIKFHIKYCDKSCQPDIIAYRKKADCIHIFEVKDTTGIKGIGQTFGQIVATKLGFEKMENKKRKEIYKKLKRGNPNIRNPRIYFSVAFTKRTKNKSELIVNKLQSKYYKDIGLYYIINRNRCERVTKGHSIKLKE